ncbi:MAG: Gp49 family protein [Pseudomonadota bacterium]|nr:Gp49 family protein [Pseudomonadota bacterium]
MNDSTTTPRVRPEDVEAAIASEHYFTALDGRAGAIAAGAYAGREKPADSGSDLGPLGLLTFCVLVLRNGFTVVGKSACASPEYFDAGIGRKVARENAIQEVWPFLAYALRDRLAGHS